MKPILAADLGGTLIKLGVVLNGRVLVQKVIPARSDEPLAERLPELEHEWELLAKSIGFMVAACGGIGISFPSIMDPVSGRILTHFGKYVDAPGIDLKEWAWSRFGIPLSIENDARAALIGEWQCGAGRGCDDLVMVTLGTGIGTAAICGGQPFRGAHGQACGVGGHFTLNHDGEICEVCGNIGCAEHEASTAALPRLARREPDFAASALVDEAKLDYAAGDACAIRLRDDALRIWGATAANLVLAYDVSRVIIGGGIAEAPEVVPAIREHIHRHAISPWGKVEVVKSELGDAAALLGCEWIGRHAAGFHAPAAVSC
ncbi:ROK family protein [Luteolibacter arcticus]|uniref:ROK family protein n=1 Tax=Luteolibacter arcticus TaxID=1581411 RepID=A0ABT3GNJ1_9BACT|nr:ROK family protein [Luteolibacter arcticus]MCW1925067.1 ROK family protein [Luteolibacter arcticus]